MLRHIYLDSFLQLQKCKDGDSACQFIRDVSNPAKRHARLKKKERLSEGKNGRVFKIRHDALDYALKSPTISDPALLYEVYVNVHMINCVKEATHLKSLVYTPFVFRSTLVDLEKDLDFKFLNREKEQTPGKQFIQMHEFVKGVDTERRIIDIDFTVSDFDVYLKKVLQTLIIVQESFGLTHNDLHGKNVLVQEGTSMPVIIDWGYACFKENVSHYKIKNTAVNDIHSLFNSLLESLSEIHPREESKWIHAGLLKEHIGLLRKQLLQHVVFKLNVAWDAEKHGPLEYKMDESNEYPIFESLSIEGLLPYDTEPTEIQSLVMSVLEEITYREITERLRIDVTELVGLTEHNMSLDEAIQKTISAKITRDAIHSYVMSTLSQEEIDEWAKLGMKYRKKSLKKRARQSHATRVKHTARKSRTYAIRVKHAARARRR